MQLIKKVKNINKNNCNFDNYDNIGFNYRIIFSDIGCLAEPYKIEFDETVSPSTQEEWIKEDVRWNGDKQDSWKSG